MFLLVPYRVDVPIYRWPIANYVLLAVLVICYILEQTAAVPAIEPFVLNGWNPLGLIGHIFLHGGILHLVGNMVFLWVFGNAVCEKVGNIAYPFLFLGLGIAAGMAHLLFSDHPAIGASGAISGVMAMCLVWFPTNEISCFYFAWIFVFIRYGWFEVSSYWIMLLWLAFDILGVALGLGGIAYWAHLGGFAAGFALAMLLMTVQLVSMDDTERTLLDIFGLRRAWRDRVARSARLSENLYGSQVPAPGPAARPMRIAPETTIPILCSCGQLLKAKREFAGRTGRCPACRARILIPKE